MGPQYFRKYFKSARKTAPLLVFPESFFGHLLSTKKPELQNVIECIGHAGLPYCFLPGNQ